MSITDILNAEPQLKIIADLAASMPKDLKDFTYSNAKAKAEGLVGWDARDPALRNESAWNQYIGYLCSRMRF